MKIRLDNLKVYEFSEPIFDSLGKVVDEKIISKTAPEILAEHYPHYKEQMKKVGKRHLATPESCVEDWITINWAIEKIQNIDKYAHWTIETAVYPGAGTGNIEELQYLGLGLGGETGELLEHIKKYVRDGKIDNVAIKKELGDIFYYLCRLCIAFKIEPSEVLSSNYYKLTDRKERNMIKGSGDNR